MIQHSRRNFIAMLAGAVAAPYVLRADRAWAALMADLIPWNDQNTTLAQRLAHNNAAMPSVIAQAAASDKILDCGAMYEFSESFDLPGDIRVVGRRPGTCGFSLHDNSKYLFKVDGGAESEYGAHENLFFTRQTQPVVAHREVPFLRLTGALHGYQLNNLDMKVAGRCIQIERDSLGREPAAPWIRNCRFSGHGSAIYSRDVVNGTRIFDTNFNGGFWDMNTHYEKGELTPRSGPGWNPVKNALFEMAGSGGDGVIMHRCIANFAGGLFWSRNTSGNCVGIDIHNSWSDAASSAFVHFGGVNTRDVNIIGCKAWNFLGPNWSNGAYFESFSQLGVRKVVVEMDADGISGCVGLMVTRPDYSNSSMFDVEFRQCHASMGGRASPSALSMIEFAGANVDYARINGAWGSGYGRIYGGDGNVTNRNFINMGTLPNIQ